MRISRYTALLCLSFVVLFAMPARATIYMNTLGWTEELNQNEWEGFSNTPLWIESFTSSDDPDPPYLGPRWTPKTGH